MKKLYTALLVTVFMALSACGTTSKEIYALDGGKAQKITCVNYINDSPNLAMCYEKAGKVCGAQGYQIIGKPFYSVAKISMLVRCNKVDSASSDAPPSNDTTAESLFAELNELTNCVWAQDQYIEAGGKPEKDGNWYDKSGLGNLASNPPSCYQNGDRHGAWITRWKYNVVGVGWMQGNKENGSWVFHSPNQGMFMQGAAVDGKQQGHWVMHNADGTVLDLQLENGKIISSIPRN